MACVHRNLKRLRSLNLDGGCFDDTGLSELSELTMLSSLSLTGCDNITDDGLKAVVVPLSRHSLAWVDVHWCRRLTLFSSVSQLYQLDATPLTPARISDGIHV